MKKQNHPGKKLLAVFLVAFLLVSISLGACSPKETQGSSTGETSSAVAGNSSEVVEEDEGTAEAAETISYWVPLHANAAQVLTTWNDNEVFKKMEKETGIHVEFIHPPVGQEADQYSLMVASQNLPDIVSYDYQSGADAAFEEKIYRPLDDLLPQFAGFDRQQ